MLNRSDIIDVTDMIEQAKSALPSSIVGTFGTLTQLHSSMVPLFQTGFALSEAIVTKTGWSNGSSLFHYLFSKKGIMSHYHLPENFIDPIGIVPLTIGNTRISTIADVDEEQEDDSCAIAKNVLSFSFYGQDHCLPSLEVATHPFGIDYGSFASIDLAKYPINSVYITISDSGKINISISKVGGNDRLYGFNSLLNYKGKVISACINATYAHSKDITTIKDLEVCAYTNLFGTRMDHESVDFDHTSYGFSMDAAKNILGL